jgi:predicted house-cleaning noncanonical NTP pyrophosphatase (MazG superfamily)
LLAALRRKLVEETFEVLDAKTADQVAEELADVREVSLSIMAELGIAETNVEAARREKFNRRGASRRASCLAEQRSRHPSVFKSMRMHYYSRRLSRFL